MIEPPRILDIPAVTAAVVHVTVPRNEIQRVMGPGLHELKEALASQGVTPLGPWFTHHPRMDPAVFDFDIALPVSAPVNPVGRVTNLTLPAVTVARTILHGDYEQLHAAWPSLRETYLIDPSTNADPAAWRTELTRPLI
jgi:effector-binding domain-containing protein